MTVIKVFLFALIVVVYGRNIQNEVETNPEEGYLFEGDIVLSPTTRGVGVLSSAARWTNGIVPYVIDSGFGAGPTATIVAAMRRLENTVAINNNPCVHFRPKTAADPHFVTIRPGSGCSATVGQNWGSTKVMTLQNPGCFSDGILMHEMLHLLGFWHEQSRPDRDDYLTIVYANIQAGQEHNFNKYATNAVDTQKTLYDYNSLMHYDNKAFSSNNLPTIIPKDSSAKIGQRNGLSAIDIQEVRLYYKCT